MSKIISHKGIVKTISPQVIKVSIIPQTACGGCNAKSVCSLSNSDEKIIEITNFSEHFELNEEVTVFYQQEFGYKAVLLGYFLPFIVMISTLIISFQILCDEKFSGIIALLSVAVYYVVLYFFRNKIQKHFSFSIKKTSF